MVGMTSGGGAVGTRLFLSEWRGRSGPCHDAPSGNNSLAERGRAHGAMRSAAILTLAPLREAVWVSAPPERRFRKTRRNGSGTTGGRGLGALFAAWGKRS